MARIARIVAGFALIVAGVFMLVLPGPGIITIIGGLALLSRDVPWAARLANWMRERWESLIDSETKSSGDGDTVSS